MIKNAVFLVIFYDEYSHASALSFAQYYGRYVMIHQASIVYSLHPVNSDFVMKITKSS